MQRTHPLYFRPSPATLDILTKTAPVGSSSNWGLIKTEATNISQQINLDGVPQPSYGLAFTNEPTKRSITTAKKKDYLSGKKRWWTYNKVLFLLCQKKYILCLIILLILTDK